MFSNANVFIDSCSTRSWYQDLSPGFPAISIKIPNEYVSLKWWLFCIWKQIINFHISLCPLKFISSVCCNFIFLFSSGHLVVKNADGKALLGIYQTHSDQCLNSLKMSWKIEFFRVYPAWTENNFSDATLHKYTYPPKYTPLIFF